MNTKIIPLVGALVLWFCLGIAQTTNVNIPASPEAYALMKMVNYPVNLNTGVPDITIPFYQVESGDLKLSLGISYHGGGFKINEQSTNVGLGWSLTNDIQIVRSVNGLDDFEDRVGYLANTKMKTYYPDYGTCMGCQYPFGSSEGAYPGSNIEQLAFGNIDGAPDKFSYRLLNKSGSFYFAKSNNGLSYFIVPVPFDNIQIKYDEGRFIITDTDGTVYYFGTAGTVNYSDPASQGFELSWSSGASNPMGIKTTWKCREIQNATKTEKINFSYQNKPYLATSRVEESIEYYNNPNPSTIGQAINLNNQQLTGSSTEYNYLLSQYRFYELSSPKYMVNLSDRSIFHLPYLNSQNQVVDRTFNSPGTPVAFNSTVRGIALSNITFRGGNVTFNGAEQLSSIVIKDASGVEIKSIEFNSDYTAPQNMAYARQYSGQDFKGTLYLNRIRMKSQGQEFENYGFVYDKACFGNHLKGCNAWGYTNVETTEGWMDNRVTVPNKKITQTFFKSTYNGDYVPNVVFNIGEGNEMADAAKLTKGMLQRVIYPTGGYADFDFEPNLYKENVFDYSGTYPLIQMGGGLRIRSITFREGMNGKVQSQKYYRYGELEEGLGLVMNAPPRTFLADKTIYDGFNYTQDIIYYQSYGSSLCTGKYCLYPWIKETKTTYKPSSSLSFSYPNGAPIYYTKVTEYNNDLGVQTGKKVHTFYPPFQFGYPTNLSGVISGTNIFSLETDWYIGLQKSITDHKFENGTYKLVHGKYFNYTTYKKLELPRVAFSFTKNIYVSTGGNFIPNLNLYDQSTSFGNAGLQIGADFIYGQYGLSSGKMLLSSEIEKWVNNVDTLFTNTQYSYDRLPYLQPSKTVTTNSKGEQISTAYKYAYDFPGVSIYDHMKSAPVNMISQPIEQTITNENLAKQVSKTVTNYGMVNQGAGFIAPLSMQKSVKGGALETEITFKYNDNANLIQVTGKDGVPKSYLWGYNYKYTVAEVIGADYLTATASIDIPALQSITSEDQLKTILSGLRAANPTAMVASYTYKPLKGISSITTANGSVKSYLYDDYNRLQTIKNNNGDVLEKYEYKVGQRDVSLFFYRSLPNIPMMATIKQNCEPGLVKPFNYIIQGGKYNEDAATSANYAAETELYQVNPNIGSGTGGFTASQIATVGLRSVMHSEIPYTNNTYVDFLQDESIVGSYKFPAFSRSYPELQFIMLPGTYKVSFRQDAIYGGAIIKYYVSSSAGDSFYIKQGENITLAPGVTYSIAVTNTF